MDNILELLKCNDLEEFCKQRLFDPPILVTRSVRVETITQNHTIQDNVSMIILFRKCNFQMFLQKGAIWITMKDLTNNMA